MFETKIYRLLMALVLSVTISSQAFLLAAHANETGALKYAASRVALSSDIAEHVKGYEITITNISEDSIEITNFSSQDALSGEEAYLQYRKKGTKATAGLWAGAVLFWWLFFIPVLVAVVATPVIAIKNKKKNKASWAETEKFTNKLEKTNLEPGETVSLLALVRLSNDPNIGVTYKNKVTNEVIEELVAL